MQWSIIMIVYEANIKSYGCALAVAIIATEPLSIRPKPWKAHCKGVLLDPIQQATLGNPSMNISV